MIESLFSLTRRLAALGGALAMAVGVVTVPASVASAADSTTYLDGVTTASDVAAGGGKVFVSAGDRIIVANTQGTLTDTITGLSNTVDLAITPDGTRLYAALSGSNEVVEFDTATLAITRRIDLVGYPCPSRLSLSGNKLWVGYGCAADWTSGVLGLDTSATTPEPVPVATGMYAPPLVAAAGETLLVGEQASSPADLLVYDTSGNPPSLRGAIDGHTYGHNAVEDLAITPDGATALMAFTSQVDAWDTTSLTKIHTYAAETEFHEFTRAIAISPDGAHLAEGREASFGPDLLLYDTATTEKLYTDINTAGYVIPGSLTFSGTDVFGLLNPTASTRFYLWRMHNATVPGPTLTLNGPSTAPRREPIIITGQLTLADGSAPGEVALTVARQKGSGGSSPIPPVITAVDGTFTFTDTPTIPGTFTYHVTWDGDAGSRGTKASITVTVNSS